MDKKSKFTGITGTALLTTALMFPGCDLAKPKNAGKGLTEENVAEVVQQPQIASPPAARNDINKSESVLPVPVITRQPDPEPKPGTPQILPPGWTTGKVETLEQIRTQRATANELSKTMKGDIEHIDPILVGKNIVFSDNWLRFIGDNKPLTRQQFELWRGKTDVIYDRYVDLIGTTPVGGKKVFIDARGKSYFNQHAPDAHAHRNNNKICFNTEFKFGILKEIAEQNSWSYVMMHELAHIFAFGRAWEADAENITEILVSYAMETTHGVQYGTPGKRGFHLQKTVGTGHRSRLYNHALDNLKANKIEAFGANGSRGTSFDIYIHGLVDKVGWDTYKQVFRSYDDKDFKPNIYRPKVSSRAVIRARDFFDRIEHFSGKPGVLRTLPDRGTLLDKHFNAQVTERNLKPRVNEEIGR